MTPSTGRLIVAGHSLSETINHWLSHSHLQTIYSLWLSSCMFLDFWRKLENQQRTSKQHTNVPSLELNPQPSCHLAASLARLHSTNKSPFVGTWWVWPICRGLLLISSWFVEVDELVRVHAFFFFNSICPHMGLIDLAYECFSLMSL